MNEHHNGSARRQADRASDQQPTPTPDRPGASIAAPGAGDVRPSTPLADELAEQLRQLRTVSMLRVREESERFAAMHVAAIRQLEIRVTRLEAATNGKT